MRIYIIGNDGITLCREPPATVNEGEIAVASSSPAQRQAAAGAVECSARGREAVETGRPRRDDRSAVVGDREVAGPGAAIRPEAPIGRSVDKGAAACLAGIASQWTASRPQS
jgi:hypothetical protein